MFRRQRLRIDARTQALVATLRYSLDRNVAETLRPVVEGGTISLTRVTVSGNSVPGSSTYHAGGGLCIDEYYARAEQQ